MKVTFLGSSHGIPTAERFCSCTMIEINEKLYFIDAGAPVADLVLRYGKHPNDIKAVFCTHHHGDHTDGLLNLTDLCGWAFRESEFDVFVTRAEQAEVLKACVAIASRPVDGRVKYHTASEGVIFSDENVKITYIRTRHCEPFPSYAILVEAEDKKLLFTGDMSQWLAKEDFPKYALENETDLLVCEMAHFGKENIEPYMEKLNTKKFVFNHVNFAKGTEKFKDIAEMDASGKYPYPVIAAKDGDVIEL